MKKTEEKPVKITKALIDSVLRSKRWMLRRSNDGVACSSDANGFQWRPIGVWTVAPDWNRAPNCGGGLHGNGPSTNPSECHWTSGKRLEFCETGSEKVFVDGPGGKIKCKKARILLVNELPKGIKFVGSLDLIGTQITELPEGLHVGGYLYLIGTQIKALPEGLHVGGSLYLSGTQITELPEGLHVGGSLYLSGTQITELPEGLHVGGYLYLSGTQIKALPEGLSVGGYLYLIGTQIKALPEGLHVGGYLDLSGTQITELPEGLHVGGDLHIQDCKNLKGMPKNYTVEGKIYK